MKADGSGRKVASQATRQSGQFPKKCFFTNGTYKDLEAFRHSVDSPCYTTDRTGRCYTGEELLEMSLGQKEIAEEMFLSITGQDPEVWLDEQFRIGELAICSVCGRIYQSYMKKDCPPVQKISRFRSIIMGHAILSVQGCSCRGKKREVIKNERRRFTGSGNL